MKYAAVPMVLAVTFMACAPSAPRNDNTRTSPQVTQLASEALPPSSTQRWYPMGDGGVLIPNGCTAECSIDCDVWFGTIRCGGAVGSLQVYGGLSSMAGMQLDQKDARTLGHQPLASSVGLRWGTTLDGQFCADVAHEQWNWQLCAPDSSSRREAILGLVRGYTQSFPVGSGIVCDNKGC